MAAELIFDPATGEYREVAGNPVPPDMNLQHNPDIPFPLGQPADDPNARPIVLSPLQEPIQTGPVPGYDRNAMGLAEGPLQSPGALPSLVTPTSATASPPIAAPVTPVTPATKPHVTRPAAPNLEIESRAATQAAMDSEREVGAVRGETAESQAQAYADAQVQHQMQAVEMADIAAQHKAAFESSVAATNAAIDEAKNTKIPEFFAGREGRQAVAVASMALGGMAAGLLGQARNSAADIIQHNVDGYYTRQRQHIDDLYKYADTRGKMTDQLRMQQASELSSLQAQHGVTNLAVADKIKEIAAHSQGKIDVAAADSIIAKLQQDGVKSIEEARRNNAQIALMKSQTAENYARAAHMRASANGEAAASKADIEAVKAIDRRFAQKEHELHGTQGLMSRFNKTQAISRSLRSALTSGDPRAMQAAVTLAIEEGGSALSGGKTTAFAGKTLKQMQTLQDEVTGQFGRISNGATVSPEFAAKLAITMEGAAEAARQELDENRGAIMRGELGPGGLADTPVVKHRALAHVTRLFSSVTNADGSPRYQEGGAGTAQPATTAQPAAGKTYTAMDDAALQWANANAQDPRAAEIHKRQGR